MTWGYVMLVWDKDTGVTVQEDVPWSEFTRTSKEEAQEYLEQVIGDVALEKRKTANALAAGNSLLTQCCGYRKLKSF